MRSARTTSTSGISGAGLKKCMPATRSGCASSAAIAPTEQRRRVRGQDRVGRADSLELREHRVLGLELFEHRFDHDVATRELVQLGDDAEPLERRVPGGSVELPLLDLAAEEVGDALPCRLAASRVELVADRFEPRLDAQLRDPRAHRAQTDNARPCESHVAIPRSMSRPAP